MELWPYEAKRLVRAIQQKSIKTDPEPPIPFLKAGTVSPETFFLLCPLNPIFPFGNNLNYHFDI